MPFLQSFSINTNKKAPFPFNVPAVQFAKEVKLNSKITIFVGDNGSGKSTLLEALGMYLKLPLIGGHIRLEDGFEAAKLLQPYMQLQWKRQVNRGFFFRAEDFSDFINSVEIGRNNIAASLSDLKGVVDDAIIRQMSDSANYSLHQMRKKYGDNMQAYSHGEAYLKILQTRIIGKGIYMLDEPEAALSPLKQLSLMAFILEVLKENNTQFIIATHSPILMGIPGASIYEIQETGLQETNYKDTDHYRITKTFLNTPEFYLRHF